MTMTDNGTTTTTPTTTPFDYEIHGELTRLGQAQATYARETGALYRGDGQQRYGDAEHAEQLTAIHERLDTVIGDTQQVAARIIAEQDTLLSHLTQGDALDAMNTVEQMAADTRRAFVKEDAETLPPADLITRCRVALAGTDKATQYLLGRYVGMRVAAANQEAAQAIQLDEGTRPEPMMTLAERQVLGDLATELRAKVRGPEGAKKVEAARAKRGAAEGLRSRSRALYDEAHDAPGRLQRELLASGRYSM